MILQKKLLNQKNKKKEVVQEPKALTIGEVKKIIYDTIPKANTAETYFRTLKQVYDNFKENDIYELLKKENRCRYTRRMRDIRTII